MFDIRVHRENGVFLYNDSRYITSQGLGFYFKYRWVFEYTEINLYPKTSILINSTLV